ncbi:FAS-associated factor 1-like isoform X1 [Scylla paramamosain]|uniref:FAS-associated factor 1-like isoform X1 n=1 Tax=Scylla paramamosain TaxID=85552 RepID=UPI003082DC8A
MDNDEDSFSDEFDDELQLDDDLLIADDEISPRRMSRSLIPEEIEDEVVGVAVFTDEFRSRYGRCVPLFYQGSFSEALNHSVLLPAMDKMLLAVYLHHGGSIQSNIFNSQVLCNETVVEFLAVNFVLWGWDLTHKKNKDTVMKLFVQCRIINNEIVEDLSMEKLPALLIINLNIKEHIEIIATMYGNNTVDEVMDVMLRESKKFEEQRSRMNVSL